MGNRPMVLTLWPPYLLHRPMVPETLVHKPTTLPM